MATRVISRRPLLYTANAGPVEGRPEHVRAGSSLSWFGGRLAVLQDDASFVALVDPSSGTVESIALPPDAAGCRLYDGRQGKANKPDFESGVVCRVDRREVLVAFGSGSTRRRERVAIVRLAGSGEEAASVRIVAAPTFYAALRDRVEFSGSELNIEGAVLLDNARLVLFQRGNGAPRGELAPVNATCEISWPELWSHLNATARVPPPEPGFITRYDLGAIGSVPLTLTDATMSPSPGTILYVASAEDSPDTYCDGEVAGSAIGYIAGDKVRWGQLIEQGGGMLMEKVEGIATHPTELDRAFICVDPDDAARPTELCEIELSGPWPWLS